MERINDAVPLVGGTTIVRIPDFPKRNPAQTALTVDSLSSEKAVNIKSTLGGLMTTLGMIKLLSACEKQTICTRYRTTKRIFFIFRI